MPRLITTGSLIATQALSRVKRRALRRSHGELEFRQTSAHRGLIKRVISRPELTGFCEDNNALKYEFALRERFGHGLISPTRQEYIFSRKRARKESGMASRQKPKHLKKSKLLDKHSSLPLPLSPLPQSLAELEKPNYKLIHEGSFTFSTSSTSSRQGVAAPSPMNTQGLSHERRTRGRSDLVANRTYTHTHLNSYLSSHSPTCTACTRKHVRGR